MIKNRIRATTSINIADLRSKVKAEKKEEKKRELLTAVAVFSVVVVAGFIILI
jgi:hypothetical protein|tara:strand:+ start:239 stop:397 length:159 start_codon:yes stop_codon:yes gene_type:complete